MKVTGITDNEKKVLFILLAVLLLFGSYFFGFKKLNDRAVFIENSNQQDSAEVARLESMLAREDETKRETEGYKNTIKSIIEKYPSSLPQEKVIYLLQQSEDWVGVDYSAIVFKMENLVMELSGDDVNPKGYYAAMSVPFTADYSQFKTLMQYFADLKDRTVLPIINVSYDETTGDLKGSINFKMFYLTNTGKDYEEIPETNIPSGMEDIFKSTTSEDLELYLEGLESGDDEE